MSGTFKDRLVQDEQRGMLLDESRRYIMMRPDALMGIFRNLPEAPRADALAALETSIFTQGGDSARAYHEMGGTGEALLATIAETAPMLGWGRWSFVNEGTIVRLEVTDSPFAAGFGPSKTPVCHAIKGMLRAVSGLVFGRAAEVRELQCAAMGAPSCRFEARPL